MIKKVPGKIIDSSFLYSYFQPQQSFDDDKGIRCHNFFTAFFVNLFGSGTEKIITKDNKTIYLNKGSFNEWKIKASKNVNYWTTTNNSAEYILNVLKLVKNKREVFKGLRKLEDPPIPVHDKNNTEENSWKSFTTEVEKYKKLDPTERRALKQWFQIKKDIEDSTCLYSFRSISEQMQKATNNDKSLLNKINTFFPKLKECTGQETNNNDPVSFNTYKHFFLQQYDHFCPKKLQDIITNTDNLKNITYNAVPVKNSRKANKADIVIGSFNQNTNKLNNYGVSACSSISAQAAATFLYTKSFEEIDEQAIDEIIQRGTRVHCIKSIIAGKKIEKFNIGVASSEGTKVLTEYLFGCRTISSDSCPRNLVNMIMQEFPEYNNPGYGMKTFPFAAIIAKTPNTCCIVFKSEKEFWFFDSHGDLPFAPNNQTKAGVKKYTDKQILEKDLQEYLNHNQGKNISINCFKLKNEFK